MFKKNKPLVVILIILILLTLGIGLVSKDTRIITLKQMSAGSSSYPESFKGGSLGGANVGKMWLYAPYNAGGLDGAYCAGHGRPIARKYNGVEVADSGGGGRQQETTYEYDYTVEMAQSEAYAYWAGASKEEIQDLIWASNQWLAYTGGRPGSLGPDYTGPYKTTDGGIYGRSTKFANFAYKALNSQTGELGIECSVKEDNDDRLRLMVEQNEDTYTLGPYVLSFPTQEDTLDSPSDGKFKDLIWDEIVNDFSGKFVYGDINARITFQDNLVEENAYVEVLDANGNVIKEHFPHFGEEFYIRYKTNKNSPIVDFIKPQIEVKYLKKFTNVWGHIYKPSEMKYNMLEDNAGIFDKAIKAIGGGGSTSTGKINRDQESIKLGDSDYTLTIGSDKDTTSRASSDVQGLLENPTKIGDHGLEYYFNNDRLFLAIERSPYEGELRSDILEQEEEEIISALEDEMKELLGAKSVKMWWDMMPGLYIGRSVLSPCILEMAQLHILERDD